MAIYASRIALLCICSCSYTFVPAPKVVTPPPMDPHDVHCNDGGIIPALDALGGGASIAAVGGGLLIEHTSDRLDHFTLYYAGPLLISGIVYFYSAAFGADRVERCQELKDDATAHRPPSTDIRD